MHANSIRVSPQFSHFPIPNCSPILSLNLLYPPIILSVPYSLSYLNIWCNTIDSRYSNNVGILDRKDGALLIVYALLLTKPSLIETFNIISPISALTFRDSFIMYDC